MESEFLILEKLKSNLVIEKCNDKNIRFYICQIIGCDTDGIGGYGWNSDMVDFIGANFDVKFSDEGGFQPGILLPWLMYDCPLPDIIKILTEFNLFTELLFYFKNEKYYWGSFFLPEESGIKKTFFTGIDSISQSNNLILITNGISKVLFDLEYDKSGKLVNNLLADLEENYGIYTEDLCLEEITLCENNRIVIFFEMMIDFDESDFCYISIEYFNNEIKSFEEFRYNPIDNQNLIPLDNSLAKKIEMLLKSNT
jgi:hypothetical protein